MSSQSANVIDFQAYRNARAKAAQPEAASPAWPAQPYFMWVPMWTFVPMMPVGNPTYGT
jgi:hypothetical protein